MAESSSAETPKVRLERPPTNFREWKGWVFTAIRKIARAAGVEVEIDGAQRASTGTGTGGKLAFKVSGGSGSSASETPLFVLADGSVVPGTIGGVTPTIGGDDIDDSPAPTLTIASSGTKYVVVTINSTLKVDADVYVDGYSAISSVVITATSTDPGDGGMLSTDGEFKLKLATFVDGVKTAQFFTGSKSIQVCDDGTGEARGSLGFVSL